MKNKLILTLLALSLATSLQAQEVLLEEEPGEEEETNFGPNLKHYIQSHASFGFYAGPADEGASVIYGKCVQYITGYRYKRKFTGLLAGGFDLAYRYSSFKMDQGEVEAWPDTVFWHKYAKHEKEKFDFHQISLGAYLRINFDPHRGNNLGHYLDLGATVDWIVFDAYVAKEEAADGSDLKTRFSKMPYVAPIQYSGVARLCFKHVGLIATYRFSDFFKSKYNFPELPRFTLGLELSVPGSN